jgi:hypothetical protein
MPDRWTRLAPLTGVVFVALIVVGPIALSGNTPGSDETGPKVIAFYKDHQHAQQVASLLGALGAIFLVFFAGALRTHFRNAGQEGLAAVSFGGAIMIAVGGSIFSATAFALADVPDKLDSSAAVALNVISNDFFFPFSVGLSIFMLSAAVAILRSRALPVWLGWVALLFGVVAASPVGFFAFFGVLAWVLVVAVLMYIRGGQPQSAPTT